MHKSIKCGWVGIALAVGLTLTSNAATVRISGGTLRMNDTTLRAGGLTLDSAGTLVGDGTVDASATLAGTVSPGVDATDIGTLTFADNVTFNAGTFVCHATTDTSLDKIVAAGRVTGTATLRLTKAAGAAPWRQTIMTGNANSDYDSFTPDIAGVWLGAPDVLNLIVSWNKDQTITFNALSDRKVNDTVGLYATAESARPVTFTVNSGPGAIAGDTNLSFSGLGTVNVRADQAGGEGWNPAPSVIRAVQVLEYSQSLAVDIDGDGKADPIVYDMSTGTWRVRLSGENYGTMYVYDGLMGGVGYEAVVADFDGDGIGDVAVYAAATGTWLARLSAENYASLHTYANFLGGPGWAPLAGDFDRDRKADPAVYAALDAQWQARLSAGGYSVYTTARDFLGGTGWTALAGDFDGDGQADIAVYNEAMGAWEARFSSDGYSVVNAAPAGWLGGAGMYPALADFDGDGKADPAVWDETRRVWQVRMSGSNYALVTSPVNWL